MTSLPALFLASIFAVTLGLADDPSQGNNSDESNSLDVEQALMKQNLAPGHAATEAPGDAVARLEKKLEELKDNTKGVERLWKNGVLSKVEMEQRLLKVIQCEAELVSARLAEANAKVALLESGVGSGEDARDQLASTKATLKQLSEAAEAAKAKRERAELEAAEANVHRQQQLLKLGIAARSDVDDAEEKLTQLKTQKH